MLKFNFDDKDSYKLAYPYPHIVIDDFVQDTELLSRIADNFPTSEQLPWHRFDNPRERKLAFNDMLDLPDSQDELSDLAMTMLHPDFLKRLETLTGEMPLYGDPEFLGGGLHRIETSGRLGIHTDFNFHPHMKKTRKINLLLFLNKDWSDDWGGHLEMWDKDMQNCVYRITPKFNRAVIFTIDDTSWHGHPHPITCPKDTARKSLALYYYTDGMPEKTHSTIFQPVREEGYAATQLI